MIGNPILKSGWQGTRLMIKPIPKRNYKSLARTKKNGYLDQVVEPEVYKEKKNELFDEKLRITEQMARISKSGSSWLEPYSFRPKSAWQRDKSMGGAARRPTNSGIGAGYGSRTRFFCLESRCWAIQLIPQLVQLLISRGWPIRTADLSLPKRALYQLSQSPKLVVAV